VPGEEGMVSERSLRTLTRVFWGYCVPDADNPIIEGAGIRNKKYIRIPEYICDTQNKLKGGNWWQSWQNHRCLP